MQFLFTLRYLYRACQFSKAFVFFSTAPYNKTNEKFLYQCDVSIKTKSCADDVTLNAVYMVIDLIELI